MESSNNETRISKTRVGCGVLFIISMIFGAYLKYKENGFTDFTKVERTDGTAKVYYEIGEFKREGGLPADFAVIDILGYIYDYARDDRKLESLEFYYIKKCVDEYGNQSTVISGGKVFNQNDLHEMRKYKDKHSYMYSDVNRIELRLAYARNCNGPDFKK